ncbi:hypothetical membrane protein [Pelotomaculum thermopropionicum SI]|uniref:Probable membrane transporter protein n=1 Tax=Pelotomaculum thermopropionicum (strain DSM 13744 / JCM 10971 / SI) TaxID=370438 RepID=A5D4M4_PELTS|nr:hypothetical membrane protein [Pelotomaculum thermopropionicum SI]
MYFPVSGVEVFPLIPPAVAFLVSSFTASAGVSGAFLLLPFQVSVLGFTSPSVSPTNLIYNIVATPGGLYRFIREGRMVWPLTWAVITGTLPGVFSGAWIRVRYLTDPGAFKVFVGVLLLYLGLRLLRETAGCFMEYNSRAHNAGSNFGERYRTVGKGNGSKVPPGFSAGAGVRVRRFSYGKVEYEFMGQTFSFSTAAVFFLALAVGLIGGIYGIGGGAIIAPFCVSFLGLPVYTVAGAALAGTFLTSIGGVFFFSLLAATPAGAQAAVAPDWVLGALFGAGGLFGTYLGAWLQKFLPERFIRGTLGALVTFLAAQYILQFFFR